MNNFWTLDRTKSLEGQKITLWRQHIERLHRMGGHPAGKGVLLIGRFQGVLWTRDPEGWGYTEGNRGGLTNFAVFLDCDLVELISAPASLMWVRSLVQFGGVYVDCPVIVSADGSEYGVKYRIPVGGTFCSNEEASKGWVQGDLVTKELEGHREARREWGPVWVEGDLRGAKGYRW